MLTGPTGPCGRRIVRAVVVKHVKHHLKPPGVVDRHGTDLTSMFAPPCDSRLSGSRKRMSGTTGKRFAWFAVAVAVESGDVAVVGKVGVEPFLGLGIGVEVATVS